MYEALTYETVYSIAYIFVIFMIAGILFAGGRQKAFTQTLEEYDYNLSFMSHELRSPTNTIAMMVTEMANVINKNARKTSDGRLIIEMNANDSDYFEEIKKHCTIEAQKAPQQLELILSNTKQHMPQQERKYFSAESLIQESLRKYIIEPVSYTHLTLPTTSRV